MIHLDMPHYLRVKGGGKAGKDYRNKNRQGRNGGKGQQAAQQFSRQGEKTKENRPGYINRDNTVEEVPRPGDRAPLLLGIFR
jgi:hypothetical protein